MGRVLFTSRERVAAEANRWAVAQRLYPRRAFPPPQAFPLSPVAEKSHKPESEGQDATGESILAIEAAQFIYQFPIRFHAGILELSEEIIKAISILLLGLAALFVGINIPVV